jgi:lysozyme
MTGCSAPQPPRQASVAPDQYPQTPPPQTPPPEYPPPEYPIAPAPPSRRSQGLDAVIDISAHTAVSDFRLVRASNILAVIHKASEGDFYADPECAARQPQAEAAGLLWGAYHYGKGDSSGAQQAAFFLDSSRPGPRTLLVLDFEPNEGDPSNSMTLEQAEAFVQAVASATGRLPLVYVHPTWANGGAGITPGSILARCGLWVVDYHASPTIPRAWATSGWRLWQYASDDYAGRRARGRNRIIQGLDRCDRNLFNGDVAALYQFWNAAA